MQGKLVLLTGVPGVGKTTITKAIEKIAGPIVRIGFGELISEVKQGHGHRTDYNQLRATPCRAIAVDDVRSAEEMLYKKLNDVRHETNVILDSHAVVNDWFGFRVIPEITDFEKARIDAVIVIHAPFSIVNRRLSASPEGRRNISPKLFSKHQELQDCVAVNFSLMSHCPLYVVETDDDLDKSLNYVLKIFESIKMTFVMKNDIQE